MPSEIIRVGPEEDMYFEWSHVVDAPHFVGTRREMQIFLECPGWRAGDLSENVSARLDRADRFGTSAIGGWGCDWEQGGVIYFQEGFLPRRNLRELARRMLAADYDLGQVRAGDLLEPFDD